MEIEKCNGSVAKNIKEIILRKGLKQKSVAEKAGFSEKDFSAMLTNRKIIKVSEIVNISKALGVTPNELYGLAKKEEENESQKEMI